MKMMNDKFNTRAISLLTEALLKTEALFNANKANWFADFTAHFQKTCIQIRQCQSEASLPAITYLDYSMLYTNFIIRRYVAEIFVYNDNSYLDKSQRLIGEYDVSFMFVHFDKLWERLLDEKKRYAGKVKAWEITAFMIEALPSFFSYLANVARFAIKGYPDAIPLDEINKNNVFRVNIGGYMSKPENVYTAKKNKDAKVLVKWFGERLENAYTFDDYSELDFSGQSFKLTDFRYSQFRFSLLNDVNLKDCALIGVNFHKAYMSNCCLESCSIYEADFSNAILRNVSFVNAHGRAGLPDENEWRHVGFLPVNFRNADLTGANFTGANLSGADFTGADLTNADFTDATLDNAIFDNCRGLNLG